MTTETQPQIKEFQAETKQVLRLVIHSLYSHKEIFLRELISNASDACEKLRFEALAKPDLLGADILGVRLVPDAAAGTLSIKDNGVGMSEAEVIDNLGTIARSGTKRFLDSLSGDSAKDAQLIGQFGVGFYSAFIVADRVTVLSKRADTEGVRWESDGEGAYQIQPADRTTRGTEVILHLRAEDKEFLEPSRLRQLVRKYSDHLSVPIVLKTDKEETLNQAKAFWTRPKSELKDEDYQAFYKHLTHDPEEARAWAHNKVEGNLEYTSLLYLPKRAPFDLFEREMRGEERDADGRPLCLSGDGGERGASLQPGEGDEEGGEADDAAHRPCTPLAHEADETALIHERAVVQPGGEQKQLHGEEGGEDEQPQQQSKGGARGRLHLDEVAGMGGGGQEGHGDGPEDSKEHPLDGRGSRNDLN